MRRVPLHVISFHLQNLPLNCGGPAPKTLDSLQFIIFLFFLFFCLMCNWSALQTLPPWLERRPVYLFTLVNLAWAVCTKYSVHMSTQVTLCGKKMFSAMRVSRRHFSYLCFVFISVSPSRLLQLSRPPVKHGSRLSHCLHQAEFVIKVHWVLFVGLFFGGGAMRHLAVSRIRVVFDSCYTDIYKIELGGYWKPFIIIIFLRLEPHRFWIFF